MKELGSEKVAVSSTFATQDGGKVAKGTLSPGLPSARIPPAEVADNGQLRLGLMSPSFPLSRTQ